jgi:mannan endo-1,4-beta-mannosidase
MKIMTTLWSKALRLAFAGLLLAGTVTLLPACGGSDGGDDDNPVTNTPATASLKVFTTTLSNGDVVNPNQVSSVVIKFSKVINITSAQLITLNGQAVSGATASGQDLTIPLSLAYSTSYTLTVGAKAIYSTDGTAYNEAYTLTFSTTEDPTANLPEIDSSKIDALSNASATEAAKKVYAFLLENYGKKVISAAMANVNWNTNEADLVYKATGKYPAINTFDYVHLPWSPANWIDYSNITVAKNWWNANGLIAAGWHWIVPASQDKASDLNSYTYEPGSTTFRAQNIFTEGSWEQQTAANDLSKLASMLKLLQDEGIAVIWRPLHEASGKWFWWGYSGADTYVKLWRYVYDYLKAQNINNLIWVWTSQGDDADWYPGNAYVDIIGRDLYKAKSATDNAAEFALTAKAYPNKMVTLSECGSVGTISAQWEAGGYWSYFMPWYSYDATTLNGHEHADTAWWKDAMSSSYVLTREDMPSWK